MGLLVINKTKDIEIASRVELADSAYSRLMGLMFADDFGGKDGLLLRPCNSIHCCFVRFPIDVLFLDKTNKVRRVYHSFKPWRFSSIDFKTKQVLELPAGSLMGKVEVGDQLCIS